MHFNVYEVKSDESMDRNSSPTCIHTLDRLDVEEVGTAEYVEMIQSCTDGKFNQATTS